MIATGKTTTVRDFVKMAFAYTGIELVLKGEGKDEKGIVVSCSNSKYQVEKGKEVVAVDSRYLAYKVDLLIGDPKKANTKLGWRRQYTLEELINEMMDSDLKLMTKDQYLKDGGYNIMNYFE